MEIASRTMRLPNGQEAVISSEDLTYEDLFVVADMLLEMSAERGTVVFLEEKDLVEAVRRVRSGGYDPISGETTH